MTTITTTTTTTTQAEDRKSIPSRFAKAFFMSVADPVFSTAPPSCPRCGFDGAPLLQDDAKAAQQRITELETQIKFLNQRAAATAEKLADYEDEIRILRSQSQSTSTSASASASASVPPRTPTFTPPSQLAFSTSPSPPQPRLQQPQHTRFATLTSFLPYGKRNNSSANGAPLSQTTSSPESTITSPPRTADSTLTASLQDALQRETELRKAAESRLTQANSELEDLTTQLFSQANEMVAQERKARAKLEERVEVLERRDGEKRRRLDRLEKAVARVERVRGMVGGR
ncbi:hypothetical protein CISG_04806 [Coccidioides immitis RMSCC 3703]|uniref:GDP/GTP exchange factor Sec2 N-terminal domain-containing protein n=1 Tax=Coccidioides immitis RMSCC 3703 TaxID=454286 RepID=A0A0J8TPJ5_COCIT|nr:hypothetical protein CISG_04806 [Coccidioides immitis RMSCC 3703]